VLSCAAPCSTADRTDLGRVSVVIDEIESPLDWLVRRCGRDDRPLIEVHQLQSGANLLVLQLMPRIRWRPLVVAAELIEPIQ
jgi:hypothetical protein